MPNAIAIVAVFFGSIFVVFDGHSIAKSTAAQRWPTTAGVVLKSQVLWADYSAGRPGTHQVQRAEVRFRYEVNGKPFESENLSFVSGQIGGVRRFYPPEFAGKYPVGASIRVSYNPADPSDAAVDTSYRDFGFLRLAGGIVLLVGGVYYLFAHGKRNLIAASNSG